MKMNTKYIVQAGIIAAVYSVMVLVLTAVFPFGFINFGDIQMRASEALTVLPYFTPAAIPGLFVGCAVSNAIGAATGAVGAVDIVIGSLATLLAAVASYKLRANKWLVPLPPVVINAVVIGLELYYFAPGIAWWVHILLVGAGQTIACYGLGLPLLLLLEKRKELFL
jgi:uncharacterized membrane protein